MYSTELTTLAIFSIIQGPSLHSHSCKSSLSNLLKLLIFQPQASLIPSPHTFLPARLCQSPFQFFYLCTSLLQLSHTSRILQYLSFCHGLISHNTACMSLIHIVQCVHVVSIGQSVIEPLVLLLTVFSLDFLC